MRLISFVFIFCFSAPVFGQGNKKIDSLLTEARKATQDTSKFLIYSKIAGHYQKNKDFDNAFIYTRKAKLLVYANYQKFYAKILRSEAFFLKKQTNFPAAIDTLRKAIKVGIENNLGRELASVYLDIGVVYRITGNFKSSIENILKCIPISEKFGTKSEIINAYNSLANSYSALAGSNHNAKDFEKAIEYYKKAESYIENNPELTAMIYTNLGVTNGYIGRIRNDSNVLQVARSYHLKSYEIQKKLNDTIGMIDVFGNIGVINFELGNKYASLKYLNSAENYFLKAINLGAILKLNQYSTEGNLAGNYLSIAKINHSKEILLKGIRLSEEVLTEAKKANDNIVQFNMFENLMAAYEFSGDSKMAFYYAKKCISMKDTILNSENNNTLRELSTKFETDKKEKENQILKQQGELNATQLKQQKIFSYALIVGVIFLIVFAIMIYKNLSLSKKSNSIISKQKLEVEKQKHLVEVKQKEVLDSINYAKRLQDAILPQISTIKNSFAALNAEVSLIYQPKDIVAGDFYFFEENSEYIFIAAADCTGHGVPGAMVSVVCSNALTRSVKEFNLTDPGKILDKTTEIVLDTFSKSAGQVKDGMDISFLSIHKKNKTLTWAGANNPLWRVSDISENDVTKGKKIVMQEIKPNKQPVGRSDNPLPFNSYHFSLNKGESIYLITDGYADQFGGKDGKKLKSKNLKDFLISLNDVSLDEQFIILTQKFNDWKGNFEQVDDVCIIGIKL